MFTVWQKLLLFEPFAETWTFYAQKQINLWLGSRLRVAVIWRIMLIFTLVQSRTHVDTVQTVLHGIANSRHIYWSHTMKVLGSHVTFVRRNSAAVISSRHIYFVMKMSGRMFAVNVQSVSIQHMHWNVISRHTQTSSHFAVVYVIKISNVKKTL